MNAQNTLEADSRVFNVTEWHVSDGTVASVPTKIITGPCVGYCRTIFFKNPNKKIYAIKELYGNREAFDTYLPLANHILSTVSFISTKEQQN